MAETRPIIVVKKKVSHGGHHGGAWKVAYADFVTAMMALFIVLWLLNSSKQVREAVGGYFKDPTGKSKRVGSGKTGSGDNFTLSKDNMDKLKEELAKSMRKMTNFDKLKDHIEMTVTTEGLRIELLESDVGTFFQSGIGEPSASGKEVLITLAGELGKLPNKIFLEGHTDSKPFARDAAYGNWELSADRANSARRLMQQNGLGAGQVTQVRGFADQMLRKADKPLDSSNRRISLIVQHLIGQEEEESDAKEEGGAPGHGGEKSSGHGEPAKPAIQGGTEKPSPKAEGKHG
jgi:chemotaxis protein MotB